MTPTVTAIIPTACEPHRWVLLQRAIASLQTQTGVLVHVVVVVNGVRFHLDHLLELAQRRDIHVVYSGGTGVGGAQRLGRELVTGEFFCFLDDDDEYLPDTMLRKIEPMLEDEALAVVAGNSVKVVGDREVPIMSADDIARATLDPLMALSTRNWLSAGSGMFRTAKVGVEYFDGVTGLMEWTLLAYKLASTRNIKIIETVTYRVFDTPGSLSKSAAFNHSELAVLQKILQLPLPPAAKRSVREKIGRVHHNAAYRHLTSGDRIAAITSHCQSLAAPGGLRYLLFTRKLLLSS